MENFVPENSFYNFNDGGPDDIKNTDVYKFVMGRSDFYVCIKSSDKYLRGELYLPENIEVDVTNGFVKFNQAINDKQISEK